MHSAALSVTDHEEHDKNVLILCKLLHVHPAKRKKQNYRIFLIFPQDSLYEETKEKKWKLFCRIRKLWSLFCLVIEYEIHHGTESQRQHHHGRRGRLPEEGPAIPVP
jgi:hypothetical protein